MVWDGVGSENSGLFDRTALPDSSSKSVSLELDRVLNFEDALVMQSFVSPTQKMYATSDD